MLVLPAPAKINLFLHVTGRRADGYHELQTVFQLLDVADTVTIESAETLTVSCEGIDVPQEQNLVYRAARMLQVATGYDQGAHITIEKRIPSGGGLGGGSSDAATALHGLNRLWNLGLSTAELAELGLQLGADVPVFVRGHSAWAEGVGEVLTPVSLPPSDYVIVNPGVHVPTPVVFTDPLLSRDTPTCTLAEFEGHTSGLFGRNDLEPVAARRFPEIQEVIDWLQAWGSPRMSGSGASVFLPVAGKAEGDGILTGLRSGWTGFFASGTDASVLLSALT